MRNRVSCFICCSAAAVGVWGAFAASDDLPTAYVETMGSQCFVTDVCADQYTKVEADIVVTKADATTRQQRFFGADTTDDTAEPMTFSFSMSQNDGDLFVSAAQNGKGNFSNTGVKPASYLNKRLILVLDAYNNGNTSSYAGSITDLAAGKVLKSFSHTTTRSKTAKYPICIAANGRATKCQFAHMQIHAVRVYRKNLLYRCYVPYWNADKSVVGLKELVTGAVISSECGDALTVGGDLPEDSNDWLKPFGYAVHEGVLERQILVKAVGCGRVSIGEEVGEEVSVWRPDGETVIVQPLPDEGCELRDVSCALRDFTLTDEGGLSVPSEQPHVIECTFAAKSSASVVREWKGAADHFEWDYPLNWSPFGAPQAGDDVTVPSGFNPMLTSETPELNSLTLDGTLTFTNWMTRLRAKTVTIRANAKITCAGPFTESDMSNRVWIACRDLTVAAKGSIDVVSKGYRIGGPGSNRGKPNSAGAHGGYGGKRSNSSDAVNALPCDDPSLPVCPGSAGSGTSADCAGGGAVKIEALGTVTVNGAINASVLKSYYGSRAGMGSGGSVCIECKRFICSGATIQANGGPGTGNWNEHERDTSTNSCGAPGGGGCIAIRYDVDEEQDGDFANTTISAAAGEMQLRMNSSSPIKSYNRSPTVADWLRQDADLGTLWFSDNRPVVALLGSQLSGQLVHTNRFDFESINLTAGHVRFSSEGTVVNVSGDVTVTGVCTRLEFGGSTATNRTNMCDLMSKTPWHLNVGGDMTVAGGARVDFRSAETNGVDEAGAYVSVAGAMSLIGHDGGYTDDTPKKTWTLATNTSVCVYSDPINGGAPLITVGSLWVGAKSQLTSEARGFASGCSRPGCSIIGRGPGGGRGSDSCAVMVGGGHGGNGGNRTKPDCGGGLTNDFAVVYRPSLAGSGGSGKAAGSGTAFGGGVLRVKAKTSIVVDGLVCADGETNMSVYHGGGAGGTILFDCKTFSGSETGLLTARGGGTGYASNKDCGGGGGGRIAVWTGKPWVPKAKPRHCVVTDSIESFRGCVLVSGGANDLDPKRNGEDGVANFVEFNGLPGLLLFVQ